MKPICVPCRRFFRPRHNGFRFIEAMPIVDGALPGTSEPQNWGPYKLWNGDLWECQGCGAQIVVGVAGLPMAEHYQPGFDAAALTSQLTVNDC